MEIEQYSRYRSAYDKVSSTRTVQYNNDDTANNNNANDAIISILILYYDIIVIPAWIGQFGVTHVTIIIILS